jgi:predicted nucleic acid-binding protein
MPRRFDRRRATVVAFDAVDSEPPDAVVIDTNVVAEMMPPDEVEYASCDAVFRQLVETETWERVEVEEVADAVPDLMRSYGLQSYDAVHAATLLASGVTDMVTRDAGFAVLLPEDATLHTTRRRLSRTRARRRDACGS